MTSDPERQAALASVYASVDHVDPWIGLLSEDPVPGAAVGPTLRRILAAQFRRLRDGDRFWYRHDPGLANVVRELERTTLRDVIARNTGIRGLQGQLFLSSDAQPPRHRPHQRRQRIPSMPDPSL